MVRRQRCRNFGSALWLTALKDEFSRSKLNKASHKQRIRTKKLDVKSKDEVVERDNSRDKHI